MSLTQKHQLIFSIAFLAICFYFAYPEIYHFPPQSTHVWRQTDGAGIALSYYYGAMDFLQPQILNVCDHEGFTVSEFPLLYYLAAIYYRFFGVEEGVLRLFSLFFFFWGLSALQRLSYLVSKDALFAICLPLLIFSAPLLAYYSFNFLPDAAALGLSFCSWYYLYQWIQKRRHSLLFWFCLTTTIAGLLKVISLISVVALLLVWGLNKFRLAQFKTYSHPSLSSYTQLFYLGLPLLIVGGWLYWAQQYNSQHAGYFFTGILPFWSLVPESQMLIFNKLISKWSWVYLHPVLHALVGSAFLYLLWKPKRLAPIFWWGMLLLFLANVAVFLLWFKQFNHHDYYAISLFVFPVFVLLSLASFLRSQHPSLFRHWAFKVGLLCFTCFHIFYAKQELIFRYKANSNYKAGINPNFYDTDALQTWLRSHQVAYPDKVLSLPDVSPNISLYYYRLRGWTHYNVKESWVPFAGRRTYTEKSIQYLIQQKDCRYLLINQKSFLERPALQKFLAHPMGDFRESIFLYDLRPYRQLE